MINQKKIKTALTYIHYWEDKARGADRKSRIWATREAVRELSEQETDILLGAIHVARAELQSLTPTWHVVTSQGGVVLGVYGEALLGMAQDQARKAEQQTGFDAFVRQVKGPKPSVGSVIA